jgi:hypothetical protein
MAEFKAIEAIHYVFVQDIDISACFRGDKEQSGSVGQAVLSQVLLYEVKVLIQGCPEISVKQ